MAAGRRDRAKAATRAKVLDAAGVCFRTLGYGRSTMRDVANTAGVSTGAITGHFKDKADLYRAVFGHAPVTPELGRALMLAARSGDADSTASVLAKIGEA